MKPPLISGNEVIRAFLRAGYHKVSQRGSHVKLFHPAHQITLVIPNHREVDRWTLRGIIRDAKISVQEFLHLLK
ncbi:MAG: type II toxin-antitoxin system HicA family toxin [Chlamydiae bacterium]|nr:type II toxin-antitoxin system HicA family toxin [Chlamydiota bacterium]MBI3278105.1 type II toxin-antitoxin system HicA family toxin [Chlamydiota bacterium]